MGLNFRKSITICKGVKLNIGKSGVGVSVGTKGAHYSMNTSGRRAATVGIPGTGLSYTKNFSSSKKKSAADKKSTSAASAKRAELEQKRAELEKAKADEAQQNALIVEEAENYIDLIKSVHKECNKDINWAVKNPSLAKRIIDGDIDAYLEAINIANPFDDLTDYGSGFEFGTDDPEVMEIEFAVKADEVVPKSTVTLLKNGKLSEKEMPKSAYYDLMQDYVCSCSIRLGREIFAIIPVKKVIVHAVDLIVDPSTGNDIESTLLSVAFDREKFENINFDRIDPSDCVNSFPCNMSFSKSAGFKQVARITK